ncbi:MAG: HPr family phosphocarrier protein [Planctomycetia bacterium]|nr:HPr family phosphocarrier protein [Planctomycetia bacterium]
MAAARRDAEILNPKGLHMRPSTRFVKLAGSFRSDVRVHCNGKAADGKSILDMAILAAECGSTLDIRAEGPDAEESVAALADLVAAHFHMEDDGDNEAV